MVMEVNKKIIQKRAFQVAGAIALLKLNAEIKTVATTYIKTPPNDAFCLNSSKNSFLTSAHSLTKFMQQR